MHGDRRSYLTARLTISADAARELLAAKGVAEADPRHPLIREQVDAHITAVDARLAPFEQVKRFALLDRELSVDKDELTPTLKIRRSVVEDRYRAELDALYE